MAMQSPTPYRPRSIVPYRSSPLFSFYQQANRLFEDVFREFEEARETFAGILSPNVDVVENDQETRIVAELPGIKEDDVELTIDNDVLTIRAEKRVERQDTDTRHLSECAYGTYQRSLRLPQALDPEQVHAHFDHGVLTVTLPRSGQDTGRRRIAIESGPAPEAPTKAKTESRH